MPTNATAVWLPQVLIESALIVISILVALGLDEWRQKREDAETAQQALSNFISEVQQNQARVNAGAPFNKGLLDVLKGRYAGSGINSVDEFVIMVESYSPLVLHSTAWDTALATGSLAKMDYNLVSKLSLTYGLQNRYELATRSGVANLTSPQNLSEERLDLAIYNSVRYLENITNMEQELGVVFFEVTNVLNSAMTSLGDTGAVESRPDAAEAARP